MNPPIYYVEGETFYVINTNWCVSNRSGNAMVEETSFSSSSFTTNMQICYEYFLHTDYSYCCLLLHKTHLGN